MPRKFQGQRNLVGCSPWGPKELDMTEWLSTHALVESSARFVRYVLKDGGTGWHKGCKLPEWGLSEWWVCLPTMTHLSWPKMPTERLNKHPHHPNFSSPRGECLPGWTSSNPPPTQDFSEAKWTLSSTEAQLTRSPPHCTVIQTMFHHFITKGAHGNQCQMSEAKIDDTQDTPQLLETQTLCFLMSCKSNFYYVFPWHFLVT